MSNPKAEHFKIVFVPGAGKDYAAYVAPGDWADTKVRSHGKKMLARVAEDLKRELFDMNLLTGEIMSRKFRP